MKPFFLSTLAALAMALAANAQTPAQINKILNTLPPEERQQYAAAYEKALMDPAVVSANEDKTAAAENHRDATKAALLAKDPSLESLISAKPANPEERKKLMQATASVRSEPQVKSANAKRATADKRYREVLNATILKIDPAIGPVLAKIQGKAPAAPAAEKPAAE